MTGLRWSCARRGLTRMSKRRSKKLHGKSVVWGLLVKWGIAQYIVVGSYGRKGDKEDPYRLGKTATHLVETAKVPSILVTKNLVMEGQKTVRAREKRDKRVQFFIGVRRQHLRQEFSEICQGFSQECS